MKRQEPVTEALHYVTQALLPEKLLRLVIATTWRSLSLLTTKVTAGPPTYRNGVHLADSLESSQRSPLMLYENGIPFLEAHVPHRHSEPRAVTVPCPTSRFSVFLDLGQF